MSIETLCVNETPNTYACGGSPLTTCTLRQLEGFLQKNPQLRPTEAFGVENAEWRALCCRSRGEGCVRPLSRPLPPVPPRCMSCDSKTVVVQSNVSSQSSVIKCNNETSTLPCHLRQGTLIDAKRREYTTCMVSTSENWRMCNSLTPSQRRAREERHEKETQALARYQSSDSVRTAFKSNENPFEAGAAVFKAAESSRSAFYEDTENPFARGAAVFKPFRSAKPNG